MRQIELIANALGTVCKVVVFVSDSQEDKANQKITEIRDYLLDMDDKLSVFKSDSEISKINNHAGEAVVSELTFSILEESIKYYKKTNGIFDILVGNSTKQFRENKIGGNVSNNVNIEDNLILNKRSRGVFLKEEYQIDLGGIAKGFAIDWIKKILKKAQINKAIINLGGSVLVLGEKTKIGIRNPLIPVNKTNEDIPFAEVMANEEIVITSGIYEQSRNQEMTEHHIIDPRTGRPSKTDLLSATVVAKKGSKADVFATAMIALGFEESVKLIKKKRLKAVLVTREGKVFASFGLKNKLFIKK